MGIASGTRLGPYEVLALIGAGGMGEVYRARDPRLGREVAAKVLPPQFSSDPDRLRRFEQEARAAGALNHPNILAVYDIGSIDGTPYIVTELLDGATLRDRLGEGGLPLRKAVECAVQIAHGLAAAHEKGILHRDLKPENIFLGRDGRVKILDFGLAKLTTPDPQDATVTKLDSSHTQPGVGLGTPGYMSPEQVRGQKADQRSDIFSLGAVLYEMLSGQRAFHGATQADIASAILKDDPPELAATGKNISPALDRIVQHCLEKSPEERFQSARDLAFHLESVSSLSDSSALPAIQDVRPWLPHSATWAITALVLAAILGGGWWLSRRSQAPISTQVQFQRLTDFAGMEETPALSPDSKSLAFVSDSSGTRQIWMLLLAGGPALQITHDSGDHLEPRWSRDSASLLYYTPPVSNEAQGSIWEIPALGGSPRQLAGALGGADVSHDGRHLAYFRLNDQKVELVVSDRDGSNVRVLSRQAPNFLFRHPRWSPDDKLIAYQHNSSIWDDDIYYVPVAGGDPVRITRDHSLMNGLSWSRDGSGVIYSTGRGNTLLYLPPMHLWLSPLAGGAPRQITYGEESDEDPDLDDHGHLVVSQRHMQFDIWRFPVGPNAAENVARGIRITHQTAQVQTPSAGPGDREITYLSDSGGHGNIWVMNLATRETRQITYEKDPRVIVGVPLWSPDGNNIAFASTRTVGTWGGDVGYWLVHPDGGNLHNLIPVGSWAAWSSDSRWIYYSALSPLRATTSYQMFKISADGGTPILVRNDTAMSGTVSPDKSTLYYVVPLQNVNGTLDYEVRVARPENGASQLLARISGNRVPVWQGLHPIVSPDGKWLAMPLNDELGTNLWALNTGDGKFRQLTDFGQRRTFIARRVSWSSDGKWIFAAVGEGDSDVVLLDDLVK